MDNKCFYKEVMPCQIGEGTRLEVVDAEGNNYGIQMGSSPEERRKAETDKYLGEPRVSLSLPSVRVCSSSVHGADAREALAPGGFVCGAPFYLGYTKGHGSGFSHGPVQRISGEGVGENMVRKNAVEVLLKFFSGEVNDAVHERIVKAPSVYDSPPKEFDVDNRGFPLISVWASRAVERLLRDVGVEFGGSRQEDGKIAYCGRFSSGQLESIGRGLGSLFENYGYYVDGGEWVPEAVVRTNNNKLYRVSARVGNTGMTSFDVEKVGRVERARRSIAGALQFLADQVRP